MASILDDMPIWTTRFDLMRRQERAASAAGVPFVKDIGVPIWTMTITSKTVSPNELDKWRAIINSVSGSLKTFNAYSKSRCWPIARPNGTGATTTTTVIEIFSDKNQVRVNVNYLLTGDLFQIGNNLHRVKTANSNLLTIEPELSEEVSVGSTVILNKPSVNMIIIPNSLSTSSGLNGRGTFSFQAIQVKDGSSSLPYNETEGVYLDFVNNKVIIISPNDSSKAFEGTITEAISAGILTFSRASSATYVNQYGSFSTAPVNVIRRPYNLVTKRIMGYLPEPPRTNFLLRSAEMDNASWSKVGMTISPNVVLSLDGAANGDRLVETNGSDHYIAQTGVSYTSGTTYCYSVFAKEDLTSAKRYLNLMFTSAAFGTNSGATFDLANGTVGAVGATLASGAISYGNGWWRIWATRVATATTSSGIRVNLVNGPTNQFGNYTGDTTSGIYFWGAQVEAGTYPTSYIPTIGSTVTRAGDVLKLDLTKVPFDQTKYSLKYDYLNPSSPFPTASGQLFGFSNEALKSFNDTIYMSNNSVADTFLRASIRSGGNSYGGSTNRTHLNTGRAIFALSLANPRSAIAVDGNPSSSQTLTTVLPATTIDRFGIGLAWADSGQPSVPISNILIVPREWSNSELLDRVTI